MNDKIHIYCSMVNAHKVKHIFNAYRYHPLLIISVGCYADVKPWKAEILQAHGV